ncbi:hypothetical protein BOO86_15745 [Mycobacterium sp. CBMA 234]|uniref:hypothetical protein n=1 Tax=Mycolicibacterium sp. CBMA 234 TaxID=1918495 RepID=UPI0012DE32F2|nr:hypothetical protein [Mycolicibacterium sp. CBMA 234]MUL65929.1 hypothetical protein [Mycolicibacterium sp. CBMA 234]
MTNNRVQLYCAYSVFGFIAAFLIGWVALAGFVPPPSPTASAGQVAQFYRGHLLGIRIGMVLALSASSLLLPWGGALCAQMLRVEGPRSPLVWTWVAAQGCVFIEFVYPCTFWLMAAFRPEDATRVQTFNDLGWLPFLGIVCSGIIQMIALAIVTFRDRTPQRVFPRWFGYFQLWCAISVALTFGVWIFKTGPLAWDGIIGFWIPVTGYFVWVVVTTVVTGRAIRNDTEQTTSEPDIAQRLATIEAQLADLRAHERPPARTA